MPERISHDPKDAWRATPEGKNLQQRLLTLDKKIRAWGAFQENPTASPPLEPSRGEYEEFARLIEQLRTLQEREAQRAVIPRDAPPDLPDSKGKRVRRRSSYPAPERDPSRVEGGFPFLEAAMNHVMESSGTSERFDFSHETLKIPEYWSSGHDKAIAEFFGWDDARGDVAVTCIPSIEALHNLDDEYLKAFYPTTKRTEPYLAFRPAWFSQSASAIKTTGGREAYPGKTYWDVYKKTMLETTRELTGARIFVDTAKKPNYTDGTQEYIYTSGSPDCIPEFLQEYLHKDPPVTHRFSLTREELDGFCEFLTDKLIVYMKSKGLRIDERDISVHLPLALLMNILMSTNDVFYPSTKTDTWEWTHDYITDPHGEALTEARALMVGNSDCGGAAGLGDRNRDVRYGDRGFRPAVIVRKHT